jgi:hypothetical protein
MKHMEDVTSRSKKFMLSLMKILEVTKKLVRGASSWLHEQKNTYIIDVTQKTFHLLSELADFIIKSNCLMQYRKQLLLRELQETLKQTV